MALNLQYRFFKTLHKKESSCADCNAIIKNQGSLNLFLIELQTQKAKIKGVYKRL